MKKTLRKKYLEKRNNLTEDYIKEKSKNIWENILKLKQYNNCETIFIFLSMKSEVDTYSFIEKAFQDKKRVCVPILKEGKANMEFSQIKDFSNLQKNNFGTLEPKFKNIVNCDEKTIVIVPAIVFSKDKYRIGYGGGYYDKFLNENKPMLSIGVCFEKFIVDKIEIEEYDRKVDIVFTEERSF